MAAEELGSWDWQTRNAAKEISHRIINCGSAAALSNGPAMVVCYCRSPSHPLLLRPLLRRHRGEARFLADNSSSRTPSTKLRAIPFSRDLDDADEVNLPNLALLKVDIDGTKLVVTCF